MTKPKNCYYQNGSEWPKMQAIVKNFTFFLKAFLSSAVSIHKILF